MDPYQSVTVVNRRSIKWEGMFGGVCLVFQPHEKKSYPPNVAIALVNDSVLRTNLASGIKTTFALGIEGDDAYPTTPLEGDLAHKNPIEQMDRRDVPRLTETEPKVLGEKGVTELGYGKNEKTVPPLPGAEDGGQAMGSNPGAVVQMASEDEVKTLNFKNESVRRGPQNQGHASNRVSNRTVS